MLTNILASIQVIASCESNKLYSYIALEQLRVVLTEVLVELTTLRDHKRGEGYYVHTGDRN